MVSPYLLEAFRKDKDSVQFRTLPRVRGTSIGSLGAGQKENQDRVAVVDYVAEDHLRNFRLFALADGVGGLSSGGQCAEAALASLTQGMMTAESRDIGVRLGEAFRYANQHVFSIYKGESATTLSVLAISSTGRIAIVSVGDSRIYRFASGASPASLEQLTEDDTIGNQVALAKGEKQSTKSPGGIFGQLTQAIGSGPEITPAINSIRHSQGDEYLLTSDGFHSVGRENMVRVLSCSNRPTQALERLAHMARWLGTKDDISSIVVSSIASVDETSKQSTPAGGILRVCSLEETSIIPGVVNLLPKVALATASGNATKSTAEASDAKGAQGSGKKGSKKTKRNKKKKKQKSAVDGDASEKEDSSASNDESKDSATQQKLEINYVSNDQD